MWPSRTVSYERRGTATVDAVERWPGNARTSYETVTRVMGVHHMLLLIVYPLGEGRAGE